MLHIVNLLIRPPLKSLKTLQNSISLVDLRIMMFCSLRLSPYLMTHSSKTSIEVNGNLARKKIEMGQNPNRDRNAHVF